MGRDGSERRAIPHAIRQRAIRHTTTIPDDGSYGTRSGDGPDGTRQARRHTIRRRPFPQRRAFTGRRDRRQTIRHATSLSCPEMSEYARNMPGYARICPEYVRNMPDDVSLPEPSGTCFMG